MPSPHRAENRSPFLDPPEEAVSPWVRLRSMTRHPFVFKRMLGAIDPAARPGDVVNVYGKEGTIFAKALYHPDSQIACRVLTHEGEPVDDAWWQGRLQQAINLRRRLNLHASTDACRLIHAEGDHLSGLIVERYADCLAFEFFSLGMFLRRELITRSLIDLLGPPASLDHPGRAAPQWRVLYRADEQIQRIEGIELNPSENTAADTVTIREHGIRYRVDLAQGHKTGFFCDQRDNRRRLATMCDGASVLDCCCYTAGFSLNAKVIGNAADVTAVDLDEAALAVAKKNVNLNQARINLVHADAFTYLRQMAANVRTFDLVVLDPPKFAPTRRDLEDAQQKYHDLNKLAAATVTPGGILLTCSCSGLVSSDMFEEIATRAIRTAGRRIQILDRSGASPDHPTTPECPETRYLKALWLRLL